MNKLIIVFAVVICERTAAQHMVGVGFGYFEPKMTIMKGYQKQMQTDFPLPPRITESFPSYYYFSLRYNTLFGKRDQFQTGASIAFMSTGGRVQYSDYSGSLTADQLIKNFSVAIPVAYAIQNKRMGGIRFGTEVQVSQSELELLFDANVANVSQKESFFFSSRHLALEPFVSLFQQFGSLELQARFGYNVAVLNGSLFLQGNKDVFLLDNSSEKVRLDWSGVRVEFLISYWLRNRIDD